MTVFVFISFAQAATCSYKHTRMHKQMSDKHVYHTLRDTHTCILRQRVHSRALPAARDLWENRTPPVLFIFPSRANTEPPSNCSRLRLLSLPNLNCNLSVVFLFDGGFFFLLQLFSLPKVLSLHLISKCKIPSSDFKSHQGFLWEIKLHSVPGITVVMRPDNPSLRLRLKPDFLLDNIAVVAWEECGHQVIDRVYMWWGARSPYLCLCVYTVSVFHLSPLSLCHCFAFGQLCIWVQTDW